MALGDPYASVAELEARLGTADDGTYTALLDASSRAVEAFTRRQFNKTATATARLFRAVDPQRLPVDDFHTVTGLAVEVGGTVWAADTYEPRPPDGISNGQTGWPFSDLMTISRYWPNSRRATIEVTAQWGWAAVPAAIKQATLDVAAIASGAEPAMVVSERLGDHSMTFGRSGLTAVNAPPELVHAAPYVRKVFGVA